jgi:hypothetical protein
MFTPTTLKDTLRRIVSDEFPTSLDVFDIEADAAIADALAGRALSDVDRDLHSGFGGVELTHLSDVIKLIGGTVSLISALKSLIGGHSKTELPGTAELQARWSDKLIRAGLTKNKAQQISARFVRDLEKTLKQS